MSEQTDEYNQDTPFEPTPGGADVPEVADDNSPERSLTPTPEEPGLPADRPLGVDAFGTTSTEERAGEGLTRKLTREEPDPAVEEVEAVRAASDGPAADAGDDDGTPERGVASDDDGAAVTPAAP